MGSEIVLMQSVDLLCDVGQVESHFSLFGDSVSVGAYRCTVCTKRTTSSEIFLNTPDGTSR
jgi:hypothetical protein